MLGAGEKGTVVVVRYIKRVSEDGQMHLRDD